LNSIKQQPKMRLHYIVLTIFSAILLQACASTQYVSDSLVKVDISQYHTYTMEDNCSDDINPIMQIRIKNALEQKLRSYDYSKSSDADCQERVVNYVEGSIVIDIIDTRSNSIIWHGAAYGPSWSSLSDPNKKVNEVVDTLLERYFNS